MQRAFNELAITAKIIAMPFYWLDANHRLLGANDLAIAALGGKTVDDVIGKTCYGAYSNNIIQTMLSHHQEVMSSGKTVVVEEIVNDNTVETTRYYAATIWPLRNDNGKTVGTVSTLTDITNKKIADERLKYEKILTHLAMVTDLLPLPVYWLDTHQKVIGVNNSYLENAGTKFSKEEIVGITALDVYPEAMAHDIMRHHNDVVCTGQIFSGEEAITDMTTGEVKYFNANVAPLRDDDGHIIGTIGVSLDITAQKEAESLRLENASHKATAEEQEKFKKIADQVAHDVRSPLASMLMIVKACQAIPERERVALREAANNIDAIANNLLSNYRKKEVEQDPSAVEERESVLLSPLILQILTDKKYQYQNRSVKFDHHFSQTGNFAWINIAPTAFKRMLSNIINNAVDALGQQDGEITLCLDADSDRVSITIEDNGKGMKAELVQKIMNHVAVTEGKEAGHGIGLTQVRDTLQDNEGQWRIESQVGIGTKFIVSFPRVESQHWIAETIQLNDDDTIVIVDDDSSIHMAWDTRFDRILKESPGLTVKHFEIGQEAVDFINNLTKDKKEKIFLLTDYELLKQNLNGLDVIKQTHIDRSILVTSHYANKSVRQSALKMDTQILPKQLASDIPIHIIQAHLNRNQQTSTDLRKVDVIFVDDDQNLLNSYAFLASGKEVDTFYDPQHFLDNAAQYHRDTKIMLDYHFNNFDKEGIQIAAQLHALEFNRLYLLSGANLSTHQIPDYLTVIRKTDVNKLEAVLSE